MPRDQAALLARVAKLLALSTSPNMHEAAAAAARAQALIEAHQLEGLLSAEREVLDVDDGRGAPLECSKRLRRWKVTLATVLGEHNACVAWTEARGPLTALCLAGRATDRDVTTALYGWLVTRIEWLSATHGAGRDRRWHEAFRIGAAEVVAQRLSSRHDVTAAGANNDDDASDDTSDDMNEDDAARHRALVVADHASRRDAVDRFVAAHLRLGKGRSLMVDAHGYRRGRAAGAAMAVRRGS